MKRLIIIGEGQTEQAFCYDVLRPYFSAKDIYIQNPTIKKSKGGIIEWKSLKKEINIYLESDTSASVTLLIDYYGIHQKHGFPGWNESLRIGNKNDRMDFLEQAMLDEIDDRFGNRFIPYVQLHEFEGLLFSDRRIFDDNFEDHEFSDYKYLEETFAQFENPEMVNDGNKTAPSKRLDRIIIGYQKPIHGSLLANEIGLTRIREKCPRFNRWIERLQSI
jgi:hypothetical protein